MIEKPLAALCLGLISQLSYVPISLAAAAERPVDRTIGCDLMIAQDAVLFRA